MNLTSFTIGCQWLKRSYWAESLQHKGGFHLLVIVLQDMLSLLTGMVLSCAIPALAQISNPALPPLFYSFLILEIIKHLMLSGTDPVMVLTPGQSGSRSGTSPHQANVELCLPLLQTLRDRPYVSEHFCLWGKTVVANINRALHILGSQRVLS